MRRTFNSIRKFSTSYTQKPKIVVLGTGWSSFKFVKGIDQRFWDVCVVSPRNHFIFTPLLASTTVGTLEFRAIVEPIRMHCQNFIQASCQRFDPANKKIICNDNFGKEPFDISYDYLVIGVGSQPTTFGIKGVKEHCNFLRQINDARYIRRRILDCFEKAASPHCTPEEKQKLLSFVIVGGGPTCVEFSAELYDFLKDDFSRWFPQIKLEELKVHLIEASDHILGAFDKKLWVYAEKKLKSRKIDLLTGTSVQEVLEDKVILKDGREIPYGLCVWSTGNMPCDLVKESNFEKCKKSGRLLVDGQLRLLNQENIYAIGDCSTQINLNLPQTAQCAQQEGQFLAKLFKLMQNGDKNRQYKQFNYIHRGVMSYIGGYRALVDLNEVKGKGTLAFLFWRSAYFTKLLSYSNKILVWMYWFKAFWFGRDISNF